MKWRGYHASKNSVYPAKDLRELSQFVLDLPVRQWSRIALPPPQLLNARAVTRPSDPPFVPPQPYSSGVGRGEFLYSSAALWTIVYPDWHVHSGGKLPLFRQGYDWKKGGRPRLTVVARRLDGEAPLVWSDLAGSGFIEGKGIEGMFMVTGIDIPSPGCWEIGAQYVDTNGEVHTVHTLSYKVWVEP